MKSVLISAVDVGRKAVETVGVRFDRVAFIMLLGDS